MLNDNLMADMTNLVRVRLRMIDPWFIDIGRFLERKCGLDDGYAPQYSRK